MEFTDDQLERYARHIILKDFGGVGQRRLLDAKVVIVGMGGLGVPVAQYLAAAGVGHLVLVDHDRVALSNLQRQVLYTTGDIGALKVERAAARLRALNPDIRIETVAEPMHAGNAEQLLSGTTLVADGTDDFSARLTLSDAAVATGTAYMSAALAPTDGQLALFDPWSGPDQPCYRCFLPEPPGEDHQRTCSEAGIIGALAGVMGSLQALEIIKYISGMPESRAGHLMIYDALDGRQRWVRICRDPGCAACGDLERRGI